SPDVQFGRLADDARMDDLYSAAQTGFGASLVAHLSGELLLGGQLPEYSGFLHLLDQGFLSEAVLPHLDRADRGDAVVVGRGGNRNRVDALPHFVEHLAVVRVLLSFRKFALK